MKTAMYTVAFNQYVDVSPPKVKIKTKIKAQNVRATINSFGCAKCKAIKTLTPWHHTVTDSQNYDPTPSNCHQIAMLTKTMQQFLERQYFNL